MRAKVTTELTGGRLHIQHVATRGGDDPIVGFQTLEPFAAYTRAFDHVAVIGTYGRRTPAWMVK